MKSRLGVIGCGAIGSAVVEAVLSQTISNYQLVGVMDIEVSESIGRLQKTADFAFVTAIDQLLAQEPDIILEAAGHSAVHAYAAQILSNGINFLPMSVGALADSGLFDELKRLGDKNGAKLLISSGAIGGLDVLRAGHAQGGLELVELTSTKKPGALAGQPYFASHDIQLEELAEAVTVFEGSARDACLAFPKSTNIAASLSLAALGFDQTRVRIVADPATPRTLHTVSAQGAFGQFHITLQNYPHSANPSTTFLACLGPIAALNNMGSTIQFV